MYAGPSNLSKTALLEQLLFIAGETSSKFSGLLKLLNGGAPDPDAVDKFLRQDVTMAKDTVDGAVEKILYYIASSRMDLIDNKEFFISIALRYRKIMGMLEASVHRLLLLSKTRNLAADEDVLPSVVRLVKLGEDTMFKLSSIIRGLLGISSGTHDVLKRIESTVDKIKLNERLADEEYRAALEKTVEKYNSEPATLVLYKEVLDSIESIMDEALDQATDLLILARSMVS